MPYQKEMTDCAHCVWPYNMTSWRSYYMPLRQLPFVNDPTAAIFMKSGSFILAVFSYFIIGKAAFFKFLICVLLVVFEL